MVERFVRLGAAIDSVGAKRVVIDTIETLFGAFSNTAILRFELRRLFAWLKDRQITAVITGEPTILTYHAYAGRLVGEHGLRLPVEPAARLLTETSAWQLAHRLVSTWTQDLDTDRVPATITRYLLIPHGSEDGALVWLASVSRHWNIDRADPR